MNDDVTECAGLWALKNANYGRNAHFLCEMPHRALQAVVTFKRKRCRWQLYRDLGDDSNTSEQ